MYDMSNNQLKYIILTGLFAIPFVPLIISASLFFPYITGKAFVFRLIVEIIFACYLILAIRDESYRPKFSWILGAILAFLAVMAVADFFAINPFKAFWSNYERMEGYSLLLHLGAYFIVLGSVFKTKEIWNKLFATSLGASVIMAIYSFMQLAGKITINQGGVRVDGTLGNASYLGIYMLFHIFFAALLFSRSEKRWQKILLAIVALTDLIILYFTATRGAILGLLGGALVAFVYLLFKSEKGDGIRKIATAGLLGLIIFVGLFVSVRNSNFVKNNSVLIRFSTLSLSEIQTQGRYYVWPMALKGFLEKPILGWGQEGFNFVFNKYYNPRMYNQEPWFDRAHSTPLDWLIAGGALGLISYLSIFFAVLLYLFKWQNDNFSKKEKAVMLGLISAYFFNNLFVFDQISSYILFFTIIAHIHFCSLATWWSVWEKIAARARKIFESEKSKPIAEALVLVFTIIIIYFVIYAPWKQNKDLLAVLQLNNEGKIGNIEDYSKPLTNYSMGFSESLEHISQIAIDFASNQKVTPELKQNLFDAVDKAFVRQMQMTPTDARYRLFYGMFLSRYGLLDRAIEQMKEAQKFSPKKQQIAFELVNNLLQSNEFAEAVQVAKAAYEEDTSDSEAKFTYALALVNSGEKTISSQLFKDIPQSEIIFNDQYFFLLLYLKQYNQIIEIAKKRIELDPKNVVQHYINLAAVYLKAGRRQDAVQTLQTIGRLQPSFRTQADYYIKEIEAGRNP
jgi:O-antigen ligase/tetratricopeptide (TPR) repeat protein